MRRLSRVFRSRTKSRSDGPQSPVEAPGSPVSPASTNSPKSSKVPKSALKNKTPKSTIIVPLYIYPVDEKAWRPLYDAIEKHPELEFLIIVNPNSGPGKPPWWPNKDYIRELPILNGYENVMTVGYVSIDYCKRDIHEVLYDIQGYSEWPQSSPEYGIHVQGIFFDETPDQYTEDNDMYLQRLTDWAKNSEGIRGPKVVVHNPGTVPDPALSSSLPDVTCIVEETYRKYLGPSSEQKEALQKYNRDDACFMLHSVPRDAIWMVAKEVRQRARYVFLTDANERFYESFSEGWSHFIEAMTVD